MFGMIFSNRWCSLKRIKIHQQVQIPSTVLRNSNAVGRAGCGVFVQKWMAVSREYCKKKNAVEACAGDFQPGWEMSELFCSNRACARGSGTKSWCIWLPISKQAVQQLRTVQAEEKSVVDSVKTWPVTKMNQMDVLQLEEERIQRIHPLHLITDCCSVEGTGLFCLADLGRARMNRLKLRGIRGCFLRLFKGKDTEMLAGKITFERLKSVKV